MTISDLRNMNKREYGVWFSKVTAEDLKEVLRNENLGGGISKFKKSDLINVVMDLVDDIETELTKKLKENPKTRKRKAMDSEEKINQKTIKDNEQEEDFIHSSLLDIDNMTADEIYKEFSNEHWILEQINSDGNWVTHRGLFFLRMEDEDKARKCYRKLVKAYHPDTHKGQEDKYQLVVEAWDEYNKILNYEKSISDKDLYEF